MEECFDRLEIKLKDRILVKIKSIVNKSVGFEKKAGKIGKDDLCERKIKEKYQQIISFYMKVLEDLSAQDEKRIIGLNRLDVTDESFHSALLSACIETVSFINNSQVIKFEVLLKISEIQAFEFWKIISTFVGSDPQFPQPIKKHFYDIELQILFSLAWKKDSLVHKILQISEETNKFSNDQEMGVPKRKLSHSYEVISGE